MKLHVKNISATVCDAVIRPALARILSQTAVSPAKLMPFGAKSEESESDLAT